MNCALVTGASSGIGAEIARKLSNSGFEILLLARDPERLRQTAAQLNGPYQIVACDLTQPQQIDSFCQQWMEGRLSKNPLKALIHNAGAIHRVNFSETSDEEWERQFQLSILGPVRMTRQLFPALKECSGRVINIASTLGQRPVPSTSSYSAMKAAMINWSQSLAIEWAEFGICVNCICPGIIDTPIHQIESENKEVWIQSMEKMIPLKKVGTAENVAETVAFYCSESSSWTTGNIHVIDGGLSLV